MTPKLALVTSEDEEDDIEQTAMDTPNDTDATLVEDAPPRSTVLPRKRSVPSTGVTNERRSIETCRFRLRVFLRRPLACFFYICRTVVFSFK